MTDGPLIIQSDRTLLLEIDHAQSTACRAEIATFAELERSPEHVHTYRLTDLGLWNARAAGHDAEQVVDALLRWSRYPVPQALLIDVADRMARFGRLVLEVDPVHGLVLRTSDRAVLEEVVRAKHVAPLLGPRIDADTVAVPRDQRGRLKQALLKLGWPAEDRAGYVDGAAHPIFLNQQGWELRTYQTQAVEEFFASGSGVVVLPCGAGKTLVGMAAMARARARTLILVTNTVSSRQWQTELLARTSLTEGEVGEYSGERKQIRPVTVATYQILTTKRAGLFPHLELLSAEDWGLIIYDEVHLLPAPVFRMTAEIQSRRRLGLTATLVREDGREGDVFSLIGPKRYDAPWRDIEAQGWIAPANCTEVRVTLTDEERMTYALAEPEERYRVGATARSKLAVVEALVHEAVAQGEPTLVVPSDGAGERGRLPGGGKGLDLQRGGRGFERDGVVVRTAERCLEGLRKRLLKGLKEALEAGGIGRVDVRHACKGIPLRRILKWRELRRGVAVANPHGELDGKRDGARGRRSERAGPRRDEGRLSVDDRGRLPRFSGEIGREDTLGRQLWRSFERHAFHVAELRAQRDRNGLPDPCPCVCACVSEAETNGRVGAMRRGRRSRRGRCDGQGRRRDRGRFDGGDEAGERDCAEDRCIVSVHGSPILSR